MSTVKEEFSGPMAELLISYMQHLQKIDEEIKAANVFASQTGPALRNTTEQSLIMTTRSLLKLKHYDVVVMGKVNPVFEIKGDDKVELTMDGPEESLPMEQSNERIVNSPDVDVAGSSKDCHLDMGRHQESNWDHLLYLPNLW